MQKVWYRTSKGSWYGTFTEQGHQKQIRLVKAPKTKEGKKLAEAKLLEGAEVARHHGRRRRCPILAFSVELRSVRSGTCGWCRKDKDEVFDVAFSDKSFVGPMCKADLLRAVGTKVGAAEAKAPIAIPANGPVVAAK